MTRHNWPNRPDNMKLSLAEFGFVAFVFILLTAPKASIRFTGAPIYLIDLMVLFLIFFAPQARSKRVFHRSISAILGSVLFISLLSELNGFVYFGLNSLEFGYMFIRTLLSFAIFWSAVVYLQKPQVRLYTIIAMAFGTLVSATLIIISSLPPTRWLAELVFSISFLELSEASFFSRGVEEQTSGARGRSLVGVSILSANFIIVAWPFAALAAFLAKSTPIRVLSTLACFLAPVAVVMSYSRGPILGIIVVVVAAAFIASQRIRKGLIRPVVIAISIFAVVGIGSSYFMFDRIERRVQAALTDPTGDEAEYERISSYTEPFEHVQSNPMFLFIGEGYGVVRLDQASERVGMATHSAFSQIYYSRGLLAVFLYLAAYWISIFAALKVSRMTLIGPDRMLAQAAACSLIGMIPWLAFSKGAIATQRGTMLMLLIFAMTTAVSSVKKRVVPARGGKLGPAPRGHSTIR